jgi:hypothetical protein
MISDYFRIQLTENSDLFRIHQRRRKTTDGQKAATTGVSGHITPFDNSGTLIAKLTP